MVRAIVVILQHVGCCTIDWYCCLVYRDFFDSGRVCKLYLSTSVTSTGNYHNFAVSPFLVPYKYVFGPSGGWVDLTWVQVVFPFFIFSLFIFRFRCWLFCPFCLFVFFVSFSTTLYSICHRPKTKLQYAMWVRFMIYQVLFCISSDFWNLKLFVIIIIVLLNNKISCCIFNSIFDAPGRLASTSKPSYSTLSRTYSPGQHDIHIINHHSTAVMLTIVVSYHRSTAFCTGVEERTLRAWRKKLDNDAEFWRQQQHVFMFHVILSFVRRQHLLRVVVVIIFRRSHVHFVTRLPTILIVVSLAIFVTCDHKTCISP